MDLPPPDKDKGNKHDSEEEIPDINLFRPGMTEN
jgi:hypothetical protein